MAYQYSETRKHILTPELVIHDMESGKGGDKIMGVLMLLLPPLGALVATFFMYLITGGEGVEFVVGIIICGLFWLLALLLVPLGIMMLKPSRKLTAADIHIMALPDRAALTNFSVFPGAIAILMVIYGLCALIDKHKGNYFLLSDPRGRSMSFNKSYTYKEEYERGFRLSLLIYFGAIPFYIPLIFFTRSYPAATFGTFAVMLIPQGLLAIPTVREAIQDSKERKRILAERERERIEQERREELGKWK